MALAINHLFPVNPERLVERAARPIFEELAAALEEVAEALIGGDRGRTEALLESVRELDAQVRSFKRRDGPRGPGGGRGRSSRGRILLWGGGL